MLVAERDAPGTAPVPVRAIVWEPPALSVMTMDAVWGPAVVGAKCPWMLQLAPAARLDPQLFEKTNEETFAPVTFMLAMDIVPLPVLVRVTDWDTLVVPRG